MALRKKLFTALIAGLSLSYCPVSHAEVSGIQIHAIGEKLYSAFGNFDHFNDIALDFVENSESSFSCKWWVMKASQQHSIDVMQINNAPKLYKENDLAVTGVALDDFVSEFVAVRQKNMLEHVLPSLNKTCVR